MRILVVTWSWPPIGRIGALRPLGLAREWTRLGHEVHVLTGPGDRGGEHSPDLLGLGESSGAIVHRAPAPGLSAPKAAPPSYERRVEDLVARGSVSRLRQVLSQWKNFPDYQRSWIAPARRVGLALLERIPFDVLWSTSPPESVHFVARALAERGVRWIADFRDAWADYPLARWDALSRRVINLVTRRTLRHAICVTTATDGFAELLRAAGGRPTVCVRNGFDEGPLCDEAVRPRTLGYFGRIDPVAQRPDRLWPALRERRQAGRPWTVDFYAAPGGGGGAAIEVPEDLRDTVLVKPPVRHDEALREMQRRAALLVLGWEGRGGEGIIPGKLFEYVGTGRPVLLCGPSHYEARQLLESTGTGIGAWGDRETSVALESLETFTPSSAGRERLSRREGARRLLGLFEAPGLK